MYPTSLGEAFDTRFLPYINTQGFILLTQLENLILCVFFSSLFSSKKSTNPLKFKAVDICYSSSVLCSSYLHKRLLEVVRVYKIVNQTYYCLFLGFVHINPNWGCCSGRLLLILVRARIIKVCLLFMF